ncbi:hypothetical protein QF013_005977 [Pseudomonas laurylsulfatiphila]
MDERGALESIASRLAPTVAAWGTVLCRSWLASDGR